MNRSLAETKGAAREPCGAFHATATPECMKQATIIPQASLQSGREKSVVVVRGPMHGSVAELLAGSGAPDVTLGAVRGSQATAVGMEDAPERRKPRFDLPPGAA